MAFAGDFSHIDTEIKDVLVPQLVNEGKLGLKNDGENKKVLIKSVDLKKLGEDGTFMLSYCNKVKVVLVDGDNKDDETVHHLVIKVSEILL